MKIECHSNRSNNNSNQQAKHTALTHKGAVGFIFHHFLAIAVSHGRYV
jgi:hypothetical protein